MLASSLSGSLRGQATQHPPKMSQPMAADASPASKEQPSAKWLDKPDTTIPQRGHRVTPSRTTMRF